MSNVRFLTPFSTHYFLYIILFFLFGCQQIAEKFDTIDEAIKEGKQISNPDNYISFPLDLKLNQELIYQYIYDNNEESNFGQSILSAKKKFKLSVIDSTQNIFRLKYEVLKLEKNTPTKFNLLFEARTTQVPPFIFEINRNDGSFKIRNLKSIAAQFEEKILNNLEQSLLGVENNGLIKHQLKTIIQNQTESPLTTLNLFLPEAITLFSHHNIEVIKNERITFDDIFPNYILQKDMVGTASILVDQFNNRTNTCKWSKFANYSSYENKRILWEHLQEISGPFSEAYFSHFKYDHSLKNIATIDYDTGIIRDLRNSEKLKYSIFQDYVSSESQFTIKLLSK